MNKVVIDASVAIKWFIPEVHSAAAARLLDSELILYAPDLIGPEIGNTIRKKVQRGEITPEEGFEIVSAFSRMAIEIQPSQDLLTSALELAIALERTVYDCLYLTLAIAQNCAVITADRKFHDSVAASSFAKHIQWIENA